MAPAPIIAWKTDQMALSLSADMFAQSNCNIIKSLSEDSTAWISTASVLHESYVHLYDQIFDVS